MQKVIDKKICLVFVSFLFLFVFMSIVSAIDTPITVRTVYEHRVSVFVLASGEVFRSLGSFHQDTNSTGGVYVVYSGEEEKFDVRVQVKKDGQTVMNEKFGPYVAGKPIHIQMYAGNYSSDYTPDEVESALPVANVTNVSVLNTSASAINITPTSSENASANSSKFSLNFTKMRGELTGLSVFDKGTKAFKYTWYSLALVIVVIALFFLFKYYGPAIKDKIADMRSSGSSLKGSQSFGGSNILDKKLMLAEQKLRVAQAEVNRLKNYDKIKEAERRLAEDRRELERLRKGL